MNAKRIRDLAIAAGTAGLLAVSVGAASAQASTNTSNYGGGYRYGPFADQSTCLIVAAEVEQSPYVVGANCQYLTYSPITGASNDPGWYLWDFIENPNL